MSTVGSDLVSGSFPFKYMNENRAYRRKALSRSIVYSVQCLTHTHRKLFIFDSKIIKGVRFGPKFLLVYWIFFFCPEQQWRNQERNN